MCLQLHALTLRATLFNKPINKLCSSKIFHIYIYLLYFVALFANSVSQYRQTPLSITVQCTLSLCTFTRLSLFLPFLLSHLLSLVVFRSHFYSHSIHCLNLFFFSMYNVRVCLSVCALMWCVLYSLCFYLSLTLLVLIFPFSYRCQSLLHGRQSHCLSSLNSLHTYIK